MSIEDIKRIFTDFFKKDYIIGLDIGSSSVKMAQFIEKPDGLHLIKIALQDIRSDHGGTDPDESKVVAIKSLLDGIDLKRSVVIISINCHETAIKKLVTPYMPKSELAEGLRMEAKNYFPFSVDSSLLDFEIKGDIVDKGVRKYDVEVAVSPKATVDKYIALLKKAGIKPASFVPTGYALEKISTLVSSKEGKVECFIDIGKAFTELIICKGKNVLFYRKIPVAGGDFTKALTSPQNFDGGRLQLSPEEASAIQNEVGIPSDAETKIPGGKVSAMQVFAMLRDPLEQLLGELARCFDYYREKVSGGTIESITLFGGGSGLSGLTKYLADKLDMDVRIGDPLEPLKKGNYTISGDNASSYKMALAIGAALSAARGINLLPSEFKEVEKKSLQRAYIEAVATAVVILVPLLYIGMNIELGNYEKRSNVASIEIGSLQPKLKVYKAKNIAGIILADEPQWEDVFMELSNLIPPSVQLTYISAEADKITLRGIVSAEDGSQVLSGFMYKLESGIFNNVKLIESKKLGEGTGLEFELRFQVDYE